MAEKQVREIIVKFDAPGSSSAIKKLANEMGGLNKATKSIADTFQNLGGFFAAGLFGIGVREIVGMSDAMEQLSNRISVLSGGTEQAKAVMDGLLRTANATKTDIEGLATVYSRLAASTKATGISSTTLLKLTEALQNSFRLSGATMAEATGAAIQLSQGFASGQLRGQELRSVMEANVEMADLLRKRFGQNVFKEAEKGTISATKVMELLLNASDDLAARGAKLGQTFEQTVAVSMNNFKTKLLEVNKELGLSSKFASALDLITQKFTVLASAVLAFGVALAAPKLIAAGSAILAWIAALNPLLAIAGVLIAGVVIAFDNLGEIMDSISGSVSRGIDNFASFLKIQKSIVQFILSGFPAASKAVGELFDRVTSGVDSSRRAFDNFAGIGERAVAGQITDLRRLDDQRITSGRIQEEELKRAKRLEAAALARSNADNREFQLKLLNQAYDKGRLSVEAYYSAVKALDLRLLNARFEEGKVDLEEYDKKIVKLAKKDLPELNLALNAGKLTFEQYNEAVADSKLDELNVQLKHGTISIYEYDRALSKISEKLGPGGMLRLGALDYIESIGTMSDQIAAATTNAFSSLEDSFTDFLTKGKLDFQDFARSILDDIARIVVRAAIIRPIASGILSGFGGGVTAGTSAGGSYTDVSNMAKVGGSSGGAAYSGGSSLGFPGTSPGLSFSKSSSGGGWSGEAAPVMVTVNNNAGVDVATQETTGPNGERMIEFMIENKVNEGFAQGKFDKTMRSTYGLQRRGY